MLNFLVALQVISTFLGSVEKGESENLFTFLLNIPWSSPLPHPLFPFICTWGSCLAWSCCWTWQLHWRKMTVLWDMVSAKFFGTENQAVTLRLSLYLNRIHLLLDECFVLKDPAGSWPAFISPMWWLTRHFWCLIKMFVYLYGLCKIDDTHTFSDAAELLKFCTRYCHLSAPFIALV